MNIIKRFISKVFKIVVVLLVFLTLNVTPIKAETEYTEDNIFYAIGSFINSTQKGIANRLNEIEIVNLGKNYAKTLMDNGSRMTDIVRVRGNEFLFNPYGKTNIGNAIDSIYGVYNDFANYAVSKVEDDRYIVHINKTYTATHDSGYIGNRGFMIVWDNPLNNVGYSNVDYHHINVERIKDFRFYTIYGSPVAGNTNLMVKLVRNANIAYDTTDGVHNLTDGFYGGSYRYGANYGIGASANRDYVRENRPITSIRFNQVIFSNTSTYNRHNDIVPYNMDTIPTQENFTTNITNNYEPNNFYVYNFEEILNENTVINNEYITNNIITIEAVEDDDEDDDAGTGGGDDTGIGNDKDYTSLLDKILASIKALPDAIADKLDFPEGSGEEGGGFWSGLFGAIGDLVSGMSDFLTSIPNLFIELFDGLLGLVEKVVELFVPSAEQVEELKGSLQLLVDDLTGKFDFVLEPVNQIKTVYSEPKSIYDLTIEYDEQVIHVVPSFLKSSLDKLKVLLNGSVVLFTFISIYKRFVGREDVIK